MDFYLKTYSGMYGTFIPNEKLDSIRISVFSDIFVKNMKQSPISKLSRTFILHNNNAEKLLLHRIKKIILH